MDPSEIKQRVDAAKRDAGKSPWLVGYDANGIQELITASGRPISMRGASEVIKAFDAKARASNLHIFAGGGRGVCLARSRDQAEKLAARLTDEFRNETHGGVMAACAVPMDARAEAQSIRWLRHRLEIEKDAAQPPIAKLPSNKDDECAYCHDYVGTVRRKRDDEDELICRRCDAMLERGREAGERGRRRGEMSRSLIELAEDHRIAAISADGNNLGALFESLSSLEELAAVSQAVKVIVEVAHNAALACVAQDKRIPLMTGGDDVRAFVPPSAVIPYVQTLAQTVENEARARAKALRGLLSHSTADRLAALGMGIGAVVANDHYPAWRLMGYAHALERNAKTACYGQDSPRSVVDFAVVTSEESMTVDIDTLREIGDIRPLSVCTDDWRQNLRRAKGLGAIPQAQLGVLWQPVESNAELGNSLRYQVARSHHWRTWYSDVCGIDWRDPKAVVDHRPDRGLLDLYTLCKWSGKAQAK